MSKTYRNFQQVSQHFKCPVHIGKLKDPRRLPCEHTLCKDCLKGVIKTALNRRDDGLFECPECRTKHHIPNIDTEDWADWFPADAFTIIQLQTLARFQDSEVCEDHMDKFKEYYCFHHRALFCPDCVIEEHTKEPCYCRNSHDSVGEVRKHLNDLLGELRLQEERAQRITESKVAAKHSEDLHQKIWEVEHLIDRFHRTMKKKLLEAREQVEHVTKISPADRDHLRTVQHLITQTKQHVEEKIKTSSAKTKEGQHDILLLWKPLDQEVANFKRVLNAVEKRPYCVNVQVDEPFVDLLTLNQDPLVVTNETSSWTPMASDQTKDKEPRVKKAVKLQDNKISFPPIKDSKDSKQSTPSSGVGQRGRGSFNNLPSLRKVTGIDRQHTIVQKSQERFLPRIASGLVTGETTRTFNVKHLKLRGLSLQSTFEFPCEDIIVIDNHIITITERAVQKFSLRYQFLQSLGLRGPMKLAPMRDSHNVLVMDSNNAISLVATTPRLQLLYRVEPDRHYIDFCHMRTTTTEDQFGRELNHAHLALTHVWNREDCVDIMVVTYEKKRFLFGQYDEVTLNPTKVKTITGSNDEAMLRHMTSICTSSDGKRLILGTESGVVCLGRNGDVVWNYATEHHVTSVDCKKTYIFAALEREKRVLLLDQHGGLLLDNIFPAGCVISKPIRVSVSKSSMIVREFNDKEYKSLVHVFNVAFSL